MRRSKIPRPVPDPSLPTTRLRGQEQGGEQKWRKGAGVESSIVSGRGIGRVQQRGERHADERSRDPEEQEWREWLRWKDEKKWE